MWNRIPEDVRSRIIDLALDRPELSPREPAVTFSDTEGYVVSESSVYRLLKAHELITSPAFVVIKAANEFRDKHCLMRCTRSASTMHSTLPSRLRQTKASWPR